MPNYNFYNLDDKRKANVSDEDILNEIELRVQNSGIKFRARDAFKAGFSLDDIVAEADKRAAVAAGEFAAPKPEATPVSLEWQKPAEQPSPYEIPKAPSVTVPAAPGAKGGVFPGPSALVEPVARVISGAPKAEEKTPSYPAPAPIEPPKADESADQARRQLGEQTFAKPDFDKKKDAPWNDPKYTPLQRKWARYQAGNYGVPAEEADWAFTPLERAQIKTLQFEDKLKDYGTKAIQWGGTGLMAVGAAGSVATGGLSGLGAFAGRTGIGIGAGLLAELGLEKTGIAPALREAARKTREAQQPFLEKQVAEGGSPTLYSLLGEAAPVALEAIPTAASWMAGNVGYAAAPKAMKAAGGYAGELGAKIFPEKPPVVSGKAPEIQLPETPLTPEQQAAGFRRQPIQFNPALENEAHKARVASVAEGIAKLPVHEDLQMVAQETAATRVEAPNWTGSVEARARKKELRSLAKELGLKSNASESEIMAAQDAQIRRELAQSLELPQPLPSSKPGGKPILPDEFNARLDKAAADELIASGRAPVEPSAEQIAVSQINTAPPAQKTQMQAKALRAAANPNASPIETRVAADVVPAAVKDLAATGDLPPLPKYHDSLKFFDAPQQFFGKPLTDAQKKAVELAAEYHAYDPAKEAFNLASPLASVKQYHPDLGRKLFQIGEISAKPLLHKYGEQAFAILDIPQKAIKGFRWNGEFKPFNAAMPEELLRLVRHARNIPSDKPVRVTNYDAFFFAGDGMINAEILPPAMRDAVTLYKNWESTFARQMMKLPDPLLKKYGHMTRVIKDPSVLGTVRKSPQFDENWMELEGTGGFIPKDRTVTERFNFPGFDTNVHNSIVARLGQAYRKIAGEPMAEEIMSELSKIRANEYLDNLGFPKDARSRQAAFDIYRESLEHLQDVVLGKPDSSFIRLNSFLENVTPDNVRKFFRTMDKGQVMSWMRNNLGVSDAYLENMLPGPNWTESMLQKASIAAAVALTAGKPHNAISEFTSRGVPNNIAAEGFGATAKGLNTMVGDAVRKMFVKDFKPTAAKRGLPPTPIANLVDLGVNAANSKKFSNRLIEKYFTPDEFFKGLSYGLTKLSAMFKADELYQQAVKAGKITPSVENNLAFVNKYVSDSMFFNEFQYGRLWRPRFYDNAFLRLLNVFQNFKAQRMAFIVNQLRQPAATKIGGVPVGLIRYVLFMGTPAFVAQKMGLNISHWQGTIPRDWMTNIGLGPEQEKKRPGTTAALQAAATLGSVIPTHIAEFLAGPATGPFAQPLFQLLAGQPQQAGRNIGSLATNIALGGGAIGAVPIPGQGWSNLIKLVGLAGVPIPAQGLSNLIKLGYELQTGKSPMPSANPLEQLGNMLRADSQTAAPTTPEQALARWVGLRPERTAEQEKIYRSNLAKRAAAERQKTKGAKRIDKKNKGGYTPYKP